MTKEPTALQKKGAATVQHQDHKSQLQALVFAGQLKPDQRMHLTAGSIGGAIGLLTGYGVGRLRP